MSLSKLANTFKEQAAANDGNITINAASFTDSDLTPPEGLDDSLAKAYQLAEGEFLLVNTSATTIPDPEGDILEIQNANAAVLNVDASNTAVTLTIISDDSGNVEFTLVIDLSDWKFETSWQYMTGGVFENLPYSSPTFIYSTSALSEFDWQSTKIALYEGQNFTSFITLSGWLQPVVDFLTSWTSGTKLALTGSIDPSIVNDDDLVYPNMDLYVSIDATVIDLGFLEVDQPGIGFQITTTEDDEEDDTDPEIEDSTDSEDDDTTAYVQMPSLYFNLNLDAGDDISLDFSAGIIAESSAFNLNVSSDPDKPLTPLNVFSLMAGNNWFANIPATLQQFLNSIAFKTFSTSLDFSNGLNITSTSTTIGSNPDQTWTLFDGFTIEEFNVNWVVIDPGTTNAQTLYFSAHVDFFPDTFEGGFDVEITSDLSLSAAFEGTVSINKLMSNLTGGAINIPESIASVELTGFGISMDINSKYYAFDATGDVNFDIITNISLTDASIAFTSTTPVTDDGENVYTAAMTGLFGIGSLSLQTEVNYNSSSEDGSWDLSLEMQEGDVLNIGELIDGLFTMVGFTLPQSFLPDNLEVISFSLESSIPNGDAKGTYSVSAGFHWGFTFPIINQEIDIEASMTFTYDGSKADGEEWSGNVLGSITLEYFNADVLIGYKFEDNDQLLSIEWEGFVAEYNVADKSETIIFQIKNWTVGSLLTSFMKMTIDPNFELDSPWDLLNDISLDGFKVTYNLNTTEVTVDYKLPKTIDLIFIKIDGIKLVKNSNGVQIAFDGSSLVPSINDSNLFNTDSGQDVKDMPEVPGQGNQYFDLRLLAMGQHVQLDNVSGYQTIQQVTKAMEEAFETPEDGQIPIGPDSGNTLLSFNENSNWLIATDFGILNAGTSEKPVWTIDMQVVFNDPSLYGLRIAMAGDKAKIFAGLDFEIMYKKISEGVGVYQIELTLPDALRYLQFGAVNITLPSIGVEIYTNGDFMVDIGFPYNLDFSRSFTVQAIVPPGIPAMGSGGFYFGKLSSTTTTLVPQTDYGNFNPVIAFGIGIQVGVGYSVNYGLLSAGFSITIFGILEGVIAAYHPYEGNLIESNKSEVETSYYYWLQGTFGLIGKLYGSIDFGIISANVDITIEIYVQATLEAYNKMPLSIVASVDVKVTAKLKLGIITIKIRFSFKAKIRTDLTIGTDQTDMAPWNRQLQDPSPEVVMSRKMVANTPGLNRQLAVRKNDTMHYSSVLTQNSTEDKPTLNIYLIPHLTVAGPENGNLKDQSAQYATTLWIDAPEIESTDNADISSFEYLSMDFFRWLILNYVDETASQTTKESTDTVVVSDADLELLLEFLSNESTPIPIPTDALLDFLKDTFTINIQNAPESLNESTAAVFPMFFDFELSVPGANVDINFNSYNMATDEYLTEVKKWFNQLSVQVSEEQNSNAMRTANEAIEYSLSTFVFEDYFVSIGKQLIGNAEDALKNYTYPLSQGNSLAQMNSWANSLSTESGVTNSVSMPDIAKANQALALSPDLSIQIAGIIYSVALDDTFKSIGSQYALETALLISQNADFPDLLQEQEITFNGQSYYVQSGNTVADVATGLDTTVETLANDPDFQKNTLLVADAIVMIAAMHYTAKNEDTFDTVASTVYKSFTVSELLIQNQSVPGIFISGNSFNYDGTKYEIVPGDTLTSMAASLSESTGSTVTVNDLANDTEVQALNVQPLGVLLIPPFMYTTIKFDNIEDADTLETIANTYSTTAEILGSNYTNQELNNLFYESDDTKSANIPGLNCLDIQSILDYFSTNDCYGQLSGMVSRYQLHGMRLPTSLPGLTLDAKSPCTGDDCALYRLTGQQFEVPADVAEGFAINLINSSLDWIEFNGQLPEGDPKQGQLQVTLTSDDIDQINSVLGYAQDSGIDPEILKLSPAVPYSLKAVQYTFTDITKWSCSGTIHLPYGSIGNQTDVSPLIWNFPSSLLQQIALPKRAGSAFDIQIGTYNATTGEMDYRNSSYYSWSTLIEINIKKQSQDDSTGTAPFTFELIGANEAVTQILERLLLQLDPNSANNNEDIIKDIQWLYTGGEGLSSVGNTAMKTFIVQSNLSTETNPDQATSMALFKTTAETESPNGVLNPLYDFIKLLWECSITRSGGYYLLYNEIEANISFPDSIFDNSGNATVSLLVNYTSSYNNVLKEFMNCAVTGDKIDESSSVVYAESKAQTGISYSTTSSNETLQSIADQYNILISELAILNESTVALNTAASPIILEDLQYEVGLSTDTPSNTSSAIADYFGVSEGDLKDLNPGITNWDNLDVWQLLTIPTVTYQISTAEGGPGNTFLSIANYYFIDVDSLSFMIKDDALYIAETTFSIVDQVVYKQSNIQQGTAGFELLRTNPDTEADLNSATIDPETYLNNLYNLLNYNIVENKYFTKSIIGLPAGPTNEDEDEAANWNYNQVIPIATYAVDNPNMSYPEGYPQAEDNPYRGIGHILQVHFDWVDYYGNQTVTPFSDPEMDSKSPLNNPPIQVGYMDELKGFAQWPSLFTNYDVKLNGTDPEMFINFLFDTSKYENTDGQSCNPNTGDIDNMPEWQKNALHDLEIYTTIYYQITQYNPNVADQNTVSLTLETTLLPDVVSDIDWTPIQEFVKAIYSYLYAIAYCSTNTPTAPTMDPVTQSIDISKLETKSIFELVVNLNMERDMAFVNNDFKDSSSVTTANTIIQPDTKTVDGGKSTSNDEPVQNYTLTEFAVNFEKTFYAENEYMLKVATGVNDALAGGKNNQTIFVVRMGLKAGNGIYWSIQTSGSYEITETSISKLNDSGVPSSVTDKLGPLTGTVYDSLESFNTALNSVLTAQEFENYNIQIYTYTLLNGSFYAPLPVSTSLVSKNNVPICKYVSGQGLNCTEGTVANFTGIDMDIWGKQCLDAIDLFLDSQFAVPGFLVDQLKSDDEKAFLQTQGIDADSYLEAITNSKSSLADTISSKVNPILTAPEVDEASLDGAREKFKQQLLMQLGNTYTINAVVQMKATAESGISRLDENEIAPRLYGTPGIKDGIEQDSKLYSISNGKIQLNFEGEDIPSNLSFIFSTKNSSENSTVSLDMDFQITHIEFDIENVPNVEGYQASQWLTLIVPVDLAETAEPEFSTEPLQQTLGQVDIPIVLRNYPEPPTLNKQEGTAVSDSGESTIEKLENASEWNYSYTYAEVQSAQDKIYSDILFNTFDSDANSALYKSSARNLFNDMAQMITVWPAVLSDLTKYLSLISPSSDESDPNLNNAYFAMQTMVEITNNLALAWEQYSGETSDATVQQNAGNNYDFVIKQEKDENFTANCDCQTDSETCPRLLLTVVPPENMSEFDKQMFLNTLNAEQANIPNTPVVDIEGYTRVPATDKDGTVIANAYWYSKEVNEKTEYLGYLCSFEIPNRTVMVDSLNVLQFQNAWAGISIIRNEDLVEDNPTNPQFIYQTPLIRYSNKLIPLLNNGTKIDIADLGQDTNTTLADHLSTFFKTFFTYDELKQQTIKLSGTWNYYLQDNSESTLPPVQLPIMLYTPFSFQIPEDYEIPSGGCPGEISASSPFVCQLAETLSLWYKDKNPNTTDAYFQFDLSVFSDVTETQLPLIQLRNLFLDYANITDLDA